MSKYVAQTLVHVRLCNCAFTLEAGSEVDVKDVRGEKCLIDFGDGDVDWFSLSWLDKYFEEKKYETVDRVTDDDASSLYGDYIP